MDGEILLTLKRQLAASTWNMREGILSAFIKVDGLVKIKILTIDG